MRTIEIDFEVFKEITLRRKNEEITPNDVLRELFCLEPRRGPMPQKAQSGKPWVAKGVVFPQGTEFRSSHKGQMYYARVDDGSLVLNDKRFYSPSAAAIEVTGNSKNGWIFWECKFPGKQNWQIINTLRQRSLSRPLTVEELAEFD
ncbi:MAG: hypothetical protein NTW80_03035 [Deltaproteobacteria bacterium]|nr:hypothetical protein [Deltaproteobacteria bacterium]